MRPDTSRALPVVLAAAAFYAAFTLTALALHGWNPLWFVWIGERWANLVPGARSGYDGQFMYYFARDGWAALPHLDNPSYRLQRILYPALAWVLSAGDADALPWAMVATNAAAILVTTFLITRWLLSHGLSRWYGLVYPLFVGTLMSYSRDLTEPLACTFALGGTLCWLGERRAAAVCLLALAALARETTILFAVGLALAELVRGRWARIALLAATALPLLAWQVYLRSVIGTVPLAVATHLLHLPGLSTFSNLSLEPGRVSGLILLALPTLALAPLVVLWVVRTPRDSIAWLVAVQYALVLMMPVGAQLHVLVVGRQSAALLIALLLAFPRCPPWLRAAVTACAIVPTVLWLPPVLWWAPWTATV